MKIFRQPLLDNIAARWDKTYGQDRVSTYGEDKKLISEKLHQLIPPVSAEAIDTIIGNSSWTSFRCDVCDKEATELHHFKPTYYDPYENTGLRICLECIHKEIS